MTQTWATLARVAWTASTILFATFWILPGWNKLHSSAIVAANGTSAFTIGALLGMFGFWHVSDTRLRPSGANSPAGCGIGRSPDFVFGPDEPDSSSLGVITGCRTAIAWRRRLPELGRTAVGAQQMKVVAFCRVTASPCTCVELDSHHRPTAPAPRARPPC